MKVYIGASRHALTRVKLFSGRVERIDGVSDISPWHRKIYEGQPDPTDTETAREVLRENYGAIRSCNVFVALTDERFGRETYCEIATALRARSIFAVIWSKEKGGLSLSAHDPRVTLVDDDLAALAYIRKLMA